MGTNLSLSAGADTKLEELTEDRLIPIAAQEPPARLLERKLNLDAARIAEQVEQDLLEHLRGLSPARFEELCALYLRVLGCEDVKVVGAATAGSLGDGGMGVTGTLAQAGLPAVRLAVQAKRVTGGSRDLQVRLSEVGDTAVIPQASGYDSRPGRRTGWPPASVHPRL